MGAMEINILVNDEQYWPKNTEADCNLYGIDGDNACVIPDSSLEVGACFELRNSVELPFGLDGAAIEDRIKITIYDKDVFQDDWVDVFAPKEVWYRPNVCEKKEHEFRAQGRSSARVKVVVDFGEVETNDLCGVNEEALVSGLGDVASELGNIQRSLLEYTRGIDGNLRRKLIFPLLASGFRVLASGARSFSGLFTRSRASNFLSTATDILSTAADVTQIGSLIFGNSESSGPNYVPLFYKVFDRFDEIDGRLDSIHQEIKNGFEAIKLVVQEEFAENELDNWITFRLGVDMRSAYDGYLARGHTVSSRLRYEQQFRESCTGDYSPYNIFQVLYAHACLDCSRFNARKAQQYFLDTYVDLASANFEDPTERVLWFRRSFGTVITAALIESIYFHSVCLHRNPDECDTPDPVWDDRLKEMGYALEEVVASLGEAETRLD